MKKITATILLTAFYIVLSGQEKPRWLDENQRGRDYPSPAYFTGFAYGEASSGKSLQDITQQIKTEALADLSKKIILQISTESKNKITTVGMNGQYFETEDFINESVVKSNVKAVGITIESYRDPSAGIIYAFAAVCRAELIAFYGKQIDSDLNKAETELSISGQLATAGKKISAFRKCEEAEKILEEVVYGQFLLTAVDAGSGAEVLQTARCNNLRLAVNRIKSNLEQSTFVYLNCKYELKGYENDAFDSDPGIICDIVAQALSENHCSVTENLDEADYELTLTASTMLRSDGKGQYGIISYYANVKGSLYNRMTKKKTADFSILNEEYSGGRSAEDAAVRAFKSPSLKDKIMKKILDKIAN